MNRKEAFKHKKRKSKKLGILLWVFVFAFVAALIMFLFALGGAENVGAILGNRNYWLCNA